MKHTLALCITLYILGMIFTFGYAAHHYKCDTIHDVQSCNLQAGGGGMIASLFMPFYWSWEIQE